MIKGTLTVSYSVDENTSSQYRTGTIYGTFGGEEFVFTVKQKGGSPKYKVTFGKNGGTGGDNFVTVTYGKPMPTPRTAPKKDGYVFDGYWDTTKDGGKQYYGANMNSVRNWDKQFSCTLWAKWNPVSNPSSSTTITLGKNGGSGGTATVTATRGRAMPSITVPTCANWTFAGYWTSTGAGGVQYYKADGTSARNWDKTAASITLWAKWTRRVNLGKNGGVGGDSYVTVTLNQPMPSPRNMPTKSGYAFGGYWTSASSRTEQWYNSNGTATSLKWSKRGGSGTPTIWALWTENSGGDDLYESFTVESKSGSYYVDFIASKALSYTSFSSSASWLHDVYTRSYTNTSGNWELDVCYTVDANTSSANRSATITGTVGHQQVTIVITQTGK